MGVNENNKTCHLCAKPLIGEAKDEILLPVDASTEGGGIWLCPKCELTAESVFEALGLGTMAEVAQG